MKLLHKLVLLSTSLIVSLTLGLTDHGNQVAAQGPAAEWQPTAFSGKIVALTEDAVVIKPAGELKITVESRRSDGTVTKIDYVQDNTQAPNGSYSASDAPASQGYARPVRAQYHRSAGRRPCHGRRVVTRPRSRLLQHAGNTPPSGWKIPRRLKIRTPPTRSVGTRMNAAQAREEKAVAAIVRIGLRCRADRESSPLSSSIYLYSQAAGAVAKWRTWRSRPGRLGFLGRGPRTPSGALGVLAPKWRSRFSTKLDTRSRLDRPPPRRRLPPRQPESNGWHGQTPVVQSISRPRPLPSALHGTG